MSNFIVFYGIKKRFLFCFVSFFEREEEADSEREKEKQRSSKDYSLPKWLQWSKLRMVTQKSLLTFQYLLKQEANLLFK